MGCQTPDSPNRVYTSKYVSLSALSVHRTSIELPSPYVKVAFEGAASTLPLALVVDVVVVVVAVVVVVVVEIGVELATIPNKPLSPQLFGYAKLKTLTE